MLTCTRGLTFLELLLALAITATLAGIAVPLTADGVDAIRTGMAARYVESRIMDARMHAVRRGARVALRFDPAARGYGFAEYLDGNGNGVRSSEIAAGTDPEITPRRLLQHDFPGVSFGLAPGVPDVDGRRFASGADADGVQIGPGRLLTLGPDGTATSGTLYLRGRRRQYAVRVLGATGRTRVLRYEPGLDQWLPR